MNAELAIPAALAAGFLGSGHCLVMCGPVVVLLEQPPVRPQALAPGTRRLILNLGRLLGYATLGAVAGAAGLVLTRLAGVDTGLRLLRYAAAALVILLGLNLLTGWRLLTPLERGGALLWQRLAPLARRLVPPDTRWRAVGAGFVWAFLPCGLVYSSVAIAATTGNAAGGAAAMGAFWLGTLPALLAAGASAHRLAALSRRPSVRRVGGGLLVLLGAAALLLPWFAHPGSAGHDHAPVGAGDTATEYGQRG